MASVHSLPPEILLVVLRLCSLAAKEDVVKNLMERTGDTDPERIEHYATSWYTPLRPYAWIKATHVCRTWRQIALDDSIIWSHVCIRSPELTAEMFRRAGNDVPLTVTFPLDRDDYPPELYVSIGIARAFIATHIARIDTLVVPAISDLFSRTQAVQAVQLQTLIFVEPSDAAFIDVSGPEKVPFPFPSLRRLHTTAQLCNPLTHLFAPTLRELVLRYHRIDSDDLNDMPDYVIPLDDLTRALRHLPLLQVLDVDLFDNDQSSPVEVALPHLHMLCLVGMAAVCAALFRALTIPRHSRMELRCLDKSIGEADAAEVIPRLLACVASDPAMVDVSRFEHPPTVSVMLKNFSWKISTWRDRQDPLEVGTSPDVVVMLPMHANGQDVLAILAACPLHDAEIVYMGTLGWYLGPATVDLGRALAALPRLRKLVLDMWIPYFAWDLVARTTATEIVFVNTAFRHDEADHQDWNTARRAGAHDVYVPWAPIHD